MTEKRYANDWAKAKSRDLVRESIQRNLHFRKPRDLRVLCFPGYDAAEITEVYDPLGIPRSNIVGVERDAEIAAELRAKNLGITVVEKSIEDYVADEPSLVFDVVSLDYTGPLNKQILKTVEDISTKQRRKDFILHIANLLKRDRDAYRHYYEGYLNRTPPHQERAPSFFELDKRMVGTVSRAIEFKQHLDQGDLRPVKEIGYSSAISTRFEYGNPDLGKLFNILMGEERNSAIAILKKSAAISGIEVDPNNPFNYTGPTEVVKKHHQDRVLASMKLALDIALQDAGIPLGYSENLLFCLVLGVNQQKFFIPTGVERYSYISESGAPMIGDISHLRYPERLQEYCNELFKGVTPKGRLALDELDGKLRRPFVHAMNEIEKIRLPLYQGREILFRERTFLGNSSRPVLTKGRAIEEFRNGATVDDLREKYRCTDTKPLAQWKAHVTMGTYDDTVNGDHTDPISKEDALDLIASGIPVEEIVSAFPEPFSIGQLRAFKAHTTMGTYAK